MLFDYLTDLLFSKLTDFLSIIEINAFEFINLPVAALDVIKTFIQIAMFFIPTATYPIFGALFVIMGVKVVIAAVDVVLTTLSLIPFIRHFI